MNTPRSERVAVRGLSYNVLRWERSGAPKLFLLHGWMDVAASFQLMVQALRHEWDLIAPDWRGFGDSESRGDCYLFLDYLADLDALAAHYARDEPLRLIGHSMGGNVACLYAGTRPKRVAAVAALDAFGAPVRAGEQAPTHWERWLAQLRVQGTGLREYVDFDELAAKLRADNPRLSAERAAWLARVQGRMGSDGRVRRAAAPEHLKLGPTQFRLEDAQAAWYRTTAKVAWIVPRDASFRHRLGVSDTDYRARTACFADFREYVIDDAGHNLHVDQPEACAGAIEDFMLAGLTMPTRSA